jgi:hypothetical protein
MGHLGESHILPAGYVSRFCRTSGSSWTPEVSVLLAVLRSARYVRIAHLGISAERQNLVKSRFGAAIGVAGANR